MADKKEVKIIAKMSPSYMGCNPKRIRQKNAPDKIALCDIYGVAVEVGHGTSRLNQDFEYLVGDFKGVNLESGDEYVSGKLFLPKNLHETVVTQLKLNQGSNVPTTFGYRISVKVDAESTVGYVYDVSLLIKPKKQDVLAQIEAEIEANRPKPEEPKSEDPAEEHKGNVKKGVK